MSASSNIKNVGSFQPAPNDPNFSILQNFKTLNVTQGGLISVPSGTRALNLIAPFNVSLKSSTLTTGQQFLVLVTGGFASAVATISLDNGGLVAGVAIYSLPQGSPLSLRFDGTNLVQQYFAQVSAAANASGGNTTYTGAFNTVLAAGTSVNIGQFQSAANNGTFTVISCNAQQLVVNNPNGVAEFNASAVAYF